MSLFLTQVELRELTGFTFKTKQIEQLRKMGIAFFTNGCGRPVVTVAAIQGIPKDAKETKPVWISNVLINNKNFIDKQKIRK